MSVRSTDRYQKFRSKAVPVGKLWMGGSHPVIIQSMTTTSTSNTEATAQQIMLLADAGCGVVRMAVQNAREARNLKNIKNILIKKGYDLPLVADVHFGAHVAAIATEYVEKVRINPGNFVKSSPARDIYTDDEYYEDLKKTEEKLVPLLELCAKHHTALRIGVNHGSLSNRILVRYGNTPEGMVESALEYVRICQRNNFNRLTLSLKASDVRTMIAANKMLVKKMVEEGAYYPVHLGVTEAGAGIDGRIKSAAGIGHLLMLGIGDTVRVSLTEDPLEEIPVARKLVEWYGKKTAPEIQAEQLIFKRKKFPGLKPPYVVSHGYSLLADFSLIKGSIYRLKEKVTTYQTVAAKTAENQEKISILKLTCHIDDPEVFRLKAAAGFSLLYDFLSPQGICIDNSFCSADENARRALDILQALGLRYSKAEFVACPSCGRTQFNIQQHLEKVKAETAHLKGLKIAVMGCVVNGPGEMAGADYGYVGSRSGEINLYKGTSLVCRNLPESLAVDALIGLIKKNGDWQEVSKEYPEQ